MRQGRWRSQGRLKTLGLDSSENCGVLKEPLRGFRFGTPSSIPQAFCLWDPAIFPPACILCSSGSSGTVRTCFSLLVNPEISFCFWILTCECCSVMTLLTKRRFGKQKPREGLVTQIRRMAVRRVEGKDNSHCHRVAKLWPPRCWHLPGLLRNSFFCLDGQFSAVERKMIFSTVGSAMYAYIQCLVSSYRKERELCATQSVHQWGCVSTWKALL